MTLLSGNAKDGVQGLRDIESAGGIGIVQDPDDAVEPRMPRSALQDDSRRCCVKASEIAPLVKKLMASAA